MTTESVRPVCASCKEECAKVIDDLRENGGGVVNFLLSAVEGAYDALGDAANAVRALPVRPVDSGEREALALAFTLEVRRFLNLDYDQRSYSWHDVVNALDSAKAVVQAGALPPDAPTGTLTAKKLASFIRDNGFVGPDELARRILAAGYRRIDAGEVVVPRELVEAASDLLLQTDSHDESHEAEMRVIKSADKLRAMLTAAAKGVGG